MRFGDEGFGMNCMHVQSSSSAGTLCSTWVDLGFLSRGVIGCCLAVQQRVPLGLGNSMRHIRSQHVEGIALVCERILA